MKETIVQGILVGLILSVGMGPVMFALIRTSLKEGFWRALMMEVGILLADASCIVLAYLLLGNITTNPKVNDYIILVGGIVLIAIGIRSFKGKASRIKEARDFIKGKQTHAAILALKGFMYNMMNPSVIIFWLGAVTLASANYSGNREKMISHFSATLITMLSFDILKALFAHSLRKFITPRFMLYSTQFMGVIFIIFGLILSIRSLIAIY